MKNILTVEIIDNDRGGHDDLLFSIPDLIGDRRFDTYYFLLAIEPFESIEEVKKATGQLLQFWKNKIFESKKGETIYLPIDFSDEYTGCLKVDSLGEQLLLTYGLSNREGWAVDPLNPENYYRTVNDFEPDSEKKLQVDKALLITNLNAQIDKLNC